MAYSNVYPAIRVERMGEIADAGVQIDTCKDEWTYVTTDSLATVEAAGYFPTQANGGPDFSRGDKITIVANQPTGNPLTGGPPQLGVYTFALATGSGDASNVLVPSQGRSQVGSAQAAIASSGNFPPIVATGAPASPGTINGDYTVAFLTIPANAFDKAGRQLTLEALGGFAANANNKRLKIHASATLPVVNTTIASATLIADTGTVATNGGGLQLCAMVEKYGAAGSNTQFGFHLGGQAGGATPALLAPASLTLAENAVIYVALTINNTTAVGDSFVNSFTGTWSN